MTDYQIVQTMRILGGSFARTLADLFDRADDDNQRRIKATWPELWAEYTELAKMRQQRQQVSHE